MRWVERWFGVLAAGLALIALAFALSQHVTQVSMNTSSVIYGPGIDTPTLLATYLPLGLAVIAALVACFAAVRDSSLGARHSAWTWLLALAALVCIAGVVALAINSIWVQVGAPPAISAEISAAAIFAPAALAAIIATFSALRPRHTVALA